MPLSRSSQPHTIGGIRRCTWSTWAGDCVITSLEGWKYGRHIPTGTRASFWELTNTFHDPKGSEHSSCNREAWSNVFVGAFDPLGCAHGLAALCCGRSSIRRHKYLRKGDILFCDFSVYGPLRCLGRYFGAPGYQAMHIIARQHLSRCFHRQPEPEVDMR